jgi:uncharacterized protein YijF (DUF1287 family)
MNRRTLISGAITAWMMAGRIAHALTPGERLAQAARAQVGVTTLYDPAYTRIPYPNGDVPRTRGVCADVIIRAGRDALGLDLQKLVHDDIAAHFDAYPSRRVWGERGPDPSIDHRRVLNLQTYFTRAGCRLWSASSPTAGDAFPLPLAVGDIVTWLLDARLPHIGIIVSSAPRNPDARVVHNIGRGAEESPLAEFHPHRAIGHYRWPRNS